MRIAKSQPCDLTERAAEGCFEETVSDPDEVLDAVARTYFEVNPHYVGRE
ncbi:hypothetical protein GCM10027597_38510 [Saccharopolyspora tripterygii]